MKTAGYLRNERAASLFALVLCLLALSTKLLAQVDTGTIYGSVSDASGALVPGAKVTVNNESTGASRSMVAGADGHYEFTQLPVATYTITVAMTAFKTYKERGVPVVVTQATRADVALEVGDITQSVDVTAAGVAQVETRDSTLGGVIEQKRIVDMPLNGRNFIQLSYFVPGATVNYRTITLKGSPMNVPGSLQVLPVINGTRNTMNAVLIDGALDNDPVLNTAAIVPVPDAIQEFKIQTNLYSAEFGQGGGSVISIVTKAGGTGFHGTAYYFGRNDVFDARNFFLDKKPALRRHQFGASAGGPVKIGGLGKNTFFFTTYEGLRLARGVLLNSIVPTLAQRAGDFSSLSTPLVDPIGGCITGNIIKLSCMDPVAVGLISKLWPAPNVRTQQFQASPILTLHRNQVLAKLDHNTARQTFSGRYVIDDGLENQPVAGLSAAGVATAGSGVPGFPVTNPSRFQNVVFSHTLLISPRSVNQFRSAYLRSVFGNNLLVNRDNPAAFGFTFPITQFPAMPGISVAGFAVSGAPAQKDFTKRNNLFFWADTLSLERGSHSLRLGGEIRRARVDVNTGNFTAGSFSFTGIVTGNSFADYLLGAPQSMLQVEGDAERNFRSTSYAAFIQDAYRLKSNFTLSYGLRWEVFGPFGEVGAKRVGHPRVHTFIPGQKSSYASDVPLGIVFADFDPVVRHTVVDTDLKNFSPRIGFAWDPSKNGKASIRAGYGIYYDATVLDGVINSTDGTPAIRPALSPFLPGPHTMADPFKGTSPYTPPITFPIPTTALLGLTVVGPDQHTAYVQQWNLTLQKQIHGSMLAEIGYVGTKGNRLVGGRNLAQALFASPTNPVNGETANTSANINQRRPYAGFSGLSAIVSEFNSHYHGLQAGLNRRNDKGLGFQLSYTFSKAIDDNSRINTLTSIEGQTGIQNAYDRKSEKALSAFDARHRFVANFSYELFSSWKLTGFSRHLVKNWQLNGIVSLQSGSPFSVNDTRGRSLTGGDDRPDLLCNPNLDSGQRTVGRWFNTSCFQAIPIGMRFGNAGRNIVFADGIKAFDFSVLKSLKTSENSRFEFRTEFFNLFNHPSFAVPVNNFASGAFGQVLATSVDERQIQFALKFVF